MLARCVDGIEGREPTAPVAHSKSGPDLGGGARTSAPKFSVGRRPIMGENVNNFLSRFLFVMQRTL